MSFFALLRRESELSLVRVGLAAVVGGIGSTLLLATINAAGQHSSDAAWSHLQLLAFLGALAAYVVAQRFLLVVAGREVEALLDRLRVRLADKLRQAGLRSVETMERSRLYGVIARDMLVLSQSGPIVMIGLQSAVQLVFIAIYLAWLSPTALLLTVLVSAFSAVSYVRIQHHAAAGLALAGAEQNRLVGTFADLLDGFKEIQMSVPRAHDLMDELARTSARATEAIVDVQEQRARLYVVAQRSLFLLAGAMVFIVPRFSTVWQGTVIEAMTTIFFLFGPLSAVVGLFVTVSTANHATGNIVALEQHLDAVEQEAPRIGTDLTACREIGLERASFRFTAEGERPFTVGPAELVATPGELIMIAGGNGSGKSTLIRLLTSLYPPISGHLTLEGRPVEPAAYGTYRSLFSAVFANDHLFERLYGIPVDADEVSRLLGELGLASKTRLVDDRFETVELSTGQRKRLALLVSLLEDRPIYVFDEWAAEQDPEFRSHFYQHILMQLKAKGKMVVAVTHDDQFFHLADRLLRMEDGRLVDDHAAQGNL